jgi:hypothetical protein
VGSFELDPETQKTIKWLNSAEGRRWSREKHQGINYGCQWYSLKRNVETSRFLKEEEFDDLSDVFDVPLGWADAAGRYRKPQGKTRNREI